MRMVMIKGGAVARSQQPATGLSLQIIANIQFSSINLYYLQGEIRLWCQK